MKSPKGVLTTYTLRTWILHFCSNPLYGVIHRVTYTSSHTLSRSVLSASSKFCVQLSAESWIHLSLLATIMPFLLVLLRKSSWAWAVHIVSLLERLSESWVRESLSLAVAGLRALLKQLFLRKRSPSP